MYCQRSFKHTKTDSLSGLIMFRGCVVFILTHLKAARFHLAGKNPPRPLCNDSLQCPQLAVDRASPTRRAIWSTLSFQQTCERISNISHFYSGPRAGIFKSHICFFSSIPAVSLTRQQDLTGRLARQACPAGLPSRLPLLVRQAFSAGRQACSAGLPSRLPLQAGRQADRLLPQDLIRKASPTRLPFQDFLLKISRGWTLPLAGSSLLQLATCLQ